LLDVGAGTAGPACFLSSAFGCRVTGVEISPSNYRLACANVEAQGRTDLVTIVSGDVTAAAFASNTFDAGIALDSCVHVRDRQKLFGLLANWLKPGALLLIAVECVSEEMPADLRHLREREGAVLCDTTAGYRSALINSGLDIVSETTYTGKRLTVSSSALRWMEMTRHTATLESMRIINAICRLGFAEEVVFVMRTPH
jgi:SAM-dependent methyltransferase